MAAARAKLEAEDAAEKAAGHTKVQTLKDAALSGDVPDHDDPDGEDDGDKEDD
jgi:hypothetical protein